MVRSAETNRPNTPHWFAGVRRHPTRIIAGLFYGLSVADGDARAPESVALTEGGAIAGQPPGEARAWVVPEAADGIGATGATPTGWSQHPEWCGKFAFGTTRAEAPSTTIGEDRPS